MKNSTIVLASTSPRRIEILKKNGIEPVIIPPDGDESLSDGIEPQDAVTQLALKKARSVEPMVRERFPDSPVIIIAADTIVYLDGIIGKPRDKEDAYAILDRLRGKEHFVATGVAIIVTGTGSEKVFCELTRVGFRDYPDSEIYSYIDTEEPYDKAGGYAIQGGWGKNVAFIMGDYDNVVGFPWTRISQELELL
ncbi:Maf family protein [Bacillota bacterium]